MPTVNAPDASEMQAAPQPPPTGPLIYGRLELLSEITGPDGAHGTELVVLRPTARAMAAVIDAPGQRAALTAFVKDCCRITNGTGGFHTFDINELNASDASEIGAILASVGEDASVGTEIRTEADGINSPIVYDLKYPIDLGGGDGEVIRQISFQARKVRDITEFLDATGAERRFYAFMHCFGQLLGTRLPMADSFIGAMDVADYLTIVQSIMGKLTGPRGRWKKA